MCPVGLGCDAPLVLMSVDSCGVGPGLGRHSSVSVKPSSREHEALIMRRVLASNRDARAGDRIPSAGVAHCLGVWVIRDYAMARGKSAEKSQGQAAGMPTFVDVRLTTAEREAFLAWYGEGVDAVRVLTLFADSSYRVGVAWVGAQQSYTVSVTCRDVESPNNGLCMTSFAADVSVAVALAWYKHERLCGGVWRGTGRGDAEVFG